MDTDDNDNTSAILTRACEAYATIALCESWLALDESRREAERRASQAAARYAQERGRALAEEGA